MLVSYLGPELILGLAALFLLALKVAGRPLTGHGATAFTTLVLVAAGFALRPLYGQHLSLLGGSFMVDSLSLYFQALFLGAALLVTWAGAGWAAHHPDSDSDFHTLLLLETAALGLMVSAGELISLYLTLEFSVITFFALAGLRAEEGEAAEATLKYVLVAGVSAALLLYGMSFLYGFTGTTNLEQIGARLEANAWSPLLLLSGLLILAGVGFKLAVFPFHFWAPDVYEAAPTPVVAFLAVASKAAALGVTLRIFTTALGSMSEEWTFAFAVVAAATAIFGNLAAIPQTNAKRLLAYSSVAQSGYMMLGLAALSPPGFSAALFYSALYTISNLTAFFVLSAWEEVTGRTDLAALAGLSQRAPFLALAMLVALLSLGGIPPLAGFVGKFTLFLAAVHQGLLWLTLIAVTMSIISVWYYLNVGRVMYVEPPAEDVVLARPAPTTLLAIGVGLVGTLAFGIFPAPLLAAAQWAARLFWG